MINSRKMWHYLKNLWWDSKLLWIIPNSNELWIWKKTPAYSKNLKLYKYYIWHAFFPTKKKIALYSGNSKWREGFNQIRLALWNQLYFEKKVKKKSMRFFSLNKFSEITLVLLHFSHTNKSHDFHFPCLLLPFKWPPMRIAVRELI